MLNVFIKGCLASKKLIILPLISSLQHRIDFGIYFAFIVVVKKTFRYSNVLFYNHLYRNSVFRNIIMESDIALLKESIRVFPLISKSSKGEGDLKEGHYAKQTARRNRLFIFPDGQYRSKAYALRWKLMWFPFSSINENDLESAPRKNRLFGFG